jgi:hypothetical protein
VKSPKRLVVALRRPVWAGDGFSASVNGQPIPSLPRPGSYVEIDRTWKTGDAIALRIPKTLHAEPLPDNPNRMAIVWGPLVLAGDLGVAQRGDGSRGRTTTKYPVFLTRSQPLGDWLKLVPGQPGSFQAEGVGATNNNVTFVPFYKLSEHRYGIYWDVFTPDEWSKKSPGYASEQEKQRKLQAATVGYAQPGEMQPERDFNFQGEEAAPVRVMDQPGRRGTKWFSFDLPVDPAHPMTLVVTYNSAETQRRTFQILVDGQVLTQQNVEKSDPARFFDVEYSIPAELVKDKQKVTVRFQAADGYEIAGVFGVRMIRADAER